jgi:undecaprenyl-diphosphatase
MDGSTNASRAGEQVYRSPADLLRLLVATTLVLVLLLVDRLFGNAVLGFLGDVLSGVAQLPSWLLTGVIVGTRLLTGVVLVAGFIAVVWQHRLRLLVMAVLGAVVGGLVGWGVSALLRQSGEPTVPVNPSLGYFSNERFPSHIGLAAVAGAVTACAPWLSRRWRRLAWTMIVGLAVSRFVTAPVSLDSAMPVAAGWFAGAALLLATGGPRRRPTTDAVVDGLTAVGLSLARLDAADVDARGSTPYFGATVDGRGVFVKVLGTDERDADTLFRLYRRIQPRDLGDEKPFSSLRRTVEHEALVSLTARSFGIPTPQVVAFATVEPNGFVLAYESVDGKSLDRVPVDELTDEIATGLWTQLAALRAHRIAHRDLRLANLFLTADGQVMLIDFGFSELAASDLLLATDLAELLTSLALAIGPARSYDTAVAVIGADGLAAARPRMKLPFLSGATRAGVKAAPHVLAELHERIGRAGLAAPSVDATDRG